LKPDFSFDEGEAYYVLLDSGVISDLTGHTYPGISSSSVFNVTTRPPVRIQIEHAGATTLIALANHFYLQDNAGTGPTLKFGGNDVVAGQFGGWTPIAAESTGSGYEVAWKVTGANQYSVWSTDANGNYTGNLVPSVTGNDPALLATESFFQQDINGDGHIASAHVPIEATARQRWRRATIISIWTAAAPVRASNSAATMLSLVSSGLDADCGGEHRFRLRSRLESHRRQPVLGVDNGRERQLPSPISCRGTTAMILLFSLPSLSSSRTSTAMVRSAARTCRLKPVA
jgi:hypothetical protein